MTLKKRSTSVIWNDPNDAPELTAAFFESADLYEGTQFKVRDCSKASASKEFVTLHLDADVLAALRASGECWQTRINDTLRAAVSLAGRV